MGRKFTFLAIVLVLTSGILIEGFAQGNEKRSKPFKDPEDGAFDISYYLYNLHGFLPILSPITEPAVGYGGALAGAFFIPKKKIDSTKFQMPDIVGLAGGYTQSKTWFAGAGYIGFWKQDHIRYRGVAGYADLNIKYYGAGDGFLSKHPINVELKPFILLQQAVFRLGKSNFMLGGKYILNLMDATLFNNSDEGWINPRDLKFTNSGMGFIGEFENFNIILSPTSGWRIHLDYTQYAACLGSDRNYGIMHFFTIWYQPLKKFWISGLRIETDAATGDPPFYMLPFITLRGIPAMRYQGQVVALAATEQLFMLNRRWGVLGFGGYGLTHNYSSDLLKGETAWSAGGGFRYLIARAMGLKMGIDVARGPEEWAFYIIFGSAWLR
jgi:hypothetical protein